MLVVGGGGVDHENVGAGVLDFDFAGSSQLGVAVLDLGLAIRPLTRLSKSSSVAPLLWSKVVPVTPPKAMKSSAGAAVLLEPPPSSCNFLVCSSSTLRDKLLIRSMKLWNCFRLRSGPKLMLQRMGRISIATKSASATEPTTFITLKAAIMTAGSFVLMTLISGTIFSCIVYLSKALDEDVFLFSSPLSPSSSPLSLVPPQSITNARRPRTLIARLFVLLKTAAITGKSSFLIVLKSSTGSTTGKLRRAASTIECVGHSIAANMTGSISDRN